MPQPGSSSHCVRVHRFAWAVHPPACCRSNCDTQHAGGKAAALLLTLSPGENFFLLSCSSMLEFTLCSVGPNLGVLVVAAPCAPRGAAIPEFSHPHWSWGLLMEKSFQRKLEVVAILQPKTCERCCVSHRTWQGIEPSSTQCVTRSCCAWGRESSFCLDCIKSSRL